MSIMVEYDLPKWCEGCQRLDTFESKRADNGIIILRTCSHLKNCEALREHWKLDDKQPATNCDKTQWISVKDELPNIHERVIALNKRNEIKAARFNGNCWIVSNTGFEFIDVEYWAPEPDMPKRGDGQ